MGGGGVSRRRRGGIYLDLRDKLHGRLVHQIDEQPSKWAPLSFVDMVYRKYRPDNAFPGLEQLVAAPVRPD
ncbi:hypothetical protein [Embleya sp. NPDC059237]|uniref:hypothetical protein n=1 Tax=Embleya sp. NPDC059237 TaxID=3346784 RepID=UPI0036932791